MTSSGTDYFATAPGLRDPEIAGQLLPLEVE